MTFEITCPDVPHALVGPSYSATSPKPVHVTRPTGLPGLDLSPFTPHARPIIQELISIHRIGNPDFIRECFSYMVLFDGLLWRVDEGQG